MDGWNTSSLWDGLLSGAMLVSGRVGIFPAFKNTTSCCLPDFFGHQTRPPLLSPEMEREMVRVPIKGDEAPNSFTFRVSKGVDGISHGEMSGALWVATYLLKKSAHDVIL